MDPLRNFSVKKKKAVVVWSVVVTYLLSRGVDTAALQHRTAFKSLTVKWWVDKQRESKEQ